MPAALRLVPFLLLICAALSAEDAALPKPDVPDPFGLGDRLALIDYLKSQLHVTVDPGATYDDLVRQYWSLVKPPPKDDPEQAKREKASELRARLHADFGITTDETDPDKLAAMLAAAADKATVHGVDPEPADHDDRPAAPPAGAVAAQPAASAAPAATKSATASTDVFADYNARFKPTSEFFSEPHVKLIDFGDSSGIDVTVPAGWAVYNLPSQKGYLDLECKDHSAAFCITLDTHDQEGALRNGLEAALTHYLKFFHQVNTVPPIQAIDIPSGRCCFCELPVAALDRPDNARRPWTAALEGLVIIGPTTAYIEMYAMSAETPQYAVGKAIINSIRWHKK
jgi:hypothetical protein